jgi:hypothetical protein
MLTPELEVLKPIDPSISHADDYEIFALSNAQIVFQSNGKPASLLAAYADTPLRVEGRLESLDRGQLKYRTLTHRLLSLGRHFVVEKSILMTLSSCHKAI